MGRRWLIALSAVGIVVFHCAVVARVFLSPEQFRLRTQQILQQFSSGAVVVGGAGYEFPGQFVIDGIELSRPEDRGGGRLFGCKAASLNFSWLSLLRGRFALDEVELVRPELALTAADLKAVQRPAGQAPTTRLQRVVVRAGRIHLGRSVLFAGSPEQELREVDLDLRQERHRASAFAFQGSADSDLWGRCDLDGTLDQGRRRLDVNLVARGIAIDQGLRELLPDAAVKALDRYNVRGVVDLTVGATVDWAAGGTNPVKMVKATIDLRDCKAAWTNFPMQLTDLRGSLVFDGTDLYYRDISGRCGAATFALHGRVTEEKIETSFLVRGRPLDQEVYKNAYDKLQHLWDRCGVESGNIDVDFRSTWDRKKRIFEASVATRLRDAKATFRAFPYPLTDLSGTVRWEGQVTDEDSVGSSQIESLTGRNGSARVEITGQVSDKGVPQLLIRAFDVPLDETLRKALTPGWCKVFDALHPEGTTWAEFRVTSATDDPKDLQYRVALRPEGASFRYEGFPHRITDVRGEIRVDEKGAVTFHNLTGRLGAFPLQFQGGVQAGPKGPVPDVTVVAPEVDLGPAARDLIGEGWRKAYDQLDPTGRVAVTWRISADPETEKPRHSTEIRCIQDCTIQHRLFPLRFTGLIGRVYVDDKGRTTFTDVRGRVGEAAVEVVDGGWTPGQDGGLRLTLKATSLALSDALRGAIPESWRKVWDEVKPSGTANVEYSYADNPKDPEHPLQRIGIEPADASFTYRRFPVPITDVTRGKITIDQDGNAIISNLLGKARGKSLRLSGKVVAGPKEPVLELDVDGSDVALDDSLRAVLPTAWQEAWDRFKPSGTIDAVASLTASLRSGEWGRFQLSAALKGCRATYAAFPVPLLDLRGRVEYQDGETRLTEVVGRSTMADQVTLVGRLCDRKEDGTRIRVRAQNVRLDEALWAALPPDVRKSVERLDLKGTADVDLTVTSAANAAEPPTCFGTVTLRDCSFKGRYPFEAANGDVSIEKGVVSAKGGQDFTGNLRLRKLIMRGMVVTDVAGGFAYSHRAGQDGQAGETALHLTNVGGSFYGGHLSAKADVDLEGQHAMVGRLSLTDVDFKVFCKEALHTDTSSTGSLGLKLEFPAARYAEQKELLGSGEAAVREGDLGELPLAASLLNVIGLGSPLDRSVTKAEMRFGIAEKHLDVKELTLSGENRLMTGWGTIGFDRKLDLTFFSPKKNTILSEIIRVLPDNLMEIKVGGTLTDPKPRINPMPIIPRALDEFNKVFHLWRERRPETPKPTPEG